MYDSKLIICKKFKKLYIKVWIKKSYTERLVAKFAEMFLTATTYLY